MKTAPIPELEDGEMASAFFRFAIILIFPFLQDLSDSRRLNAHEEINAWHPGVTCKCYSYRDLSDLKLCCP
jgi:hypothetical protein